MLLWLFVMPVGFFYFIGTATSGVGTSSGGTAKAMAEGFQTLQKAFWAQAAKRDDDTER